MWATSGGLASVTELNLLGNQLYGELPGEWGLWTSLTDLFLDGNPISGERDKGLPPLSALWLLDACLAPLAGSAFACLLSLPVGFPVCLKLVSAWQFHLGFLSVPTR